MLESKIFEEKKQATGYQPSKQEEAQINYVKGRFEDMRDARVTVDKHWDDYNKMIRAAYVKYPDHRSSSVVPLATAIIELYVAEALKIETLFQYKADTSDYETNAKALEYAWKYDFRKNNRKREFVNEEYIVGGFGTSAIYTGYEQYDKTQYDFELQEDGDYGWEEKTINHRKIIVKNTDIRNFYVDNHCNDFEQALDCTYREWISWDRFMAITKGNPLYSNLEFVAPIQRNNEYNGFTTDEERIKTGRFVEWKRYWNVDKDVYIELANDVRVRAHPMVSTIDGIKALPFALRNLGRKNYSVWGKGLCEAAMMFNAEINNLREMLMDAIRRSNTQTLALGRGLSFKGGEFSYDNEILVFDGDLSKNFQQISGNPPNQAIFNYIERIYKDIAMFVGIDVQNIIGEPQQTAFQTEVQREASQKRINVWLYNREIARERFANLYKDLLQTYFPRKTGEGIAPKIESNDEKLVDGKFKAKKGKHTFEVTPEILRGNLYTDVYTNLNIPTINAVDREQKLQYMNAIGNIAVGYANAKAAGFDIDTILPPKKIMRDLAEDYNIEVGVIEDREQVREAKKKLADNINSLMGNRNAQANIDWQGAETVNDLQSNNLEPGAEQITL